MFRKNSNFSNSFARGMAKDPNSDLKDIPEHKDLSLKLNEHLNWKPGQSEHASENRDTVNTSELKIKRHLYNDTALKIKNIELKVET